MIWLLVVAAIGIGIWRYMANQNKRQKQLAGDLAQAINDTFGYLKWRVVDPEDAEALLDQTSDMTEAIDRAVDAIERAIVDDHAGVLLGHRSGNARRWMALEEEIVNQVRHVRSIQYIYSESRSRRRLRPRCTRTRSALTETSSWSEITR